jgi:hypothetical protein
VSEWSGLGEREGNTTRSIHIVEERVDYGFSGYLRVFLVAVVRIEMHEFFELLFSSL